MKRTHTFTVPGLLFVMLGLCMCACKKSDPPLPVAGALSTDVQNDPGLMCAQLPAAPIVGWRDTSVAGDQQINAFFFNPINPNEIIFVANGDLFGYNKMYNYNLVTRKSIYLGDNGDYLPHVNKNGWVVFNRSDLNIYKVKITGDSLIQLTHGNINSDPKWDYTGNYIYCYQSATINQPSLLVKLNANGNVITTLPVDLANTAIAHQPDKIAYLKSENTKVSVYLKDLAANSETFVVSVPATQATYQTVLMHLTFDQTDKNLYWSNTDGIFKYNIAAAKLDTVKKNCVNLTYDRPIVTGTENQLTFSCHAKRAISSSRLLHQYKALELDLNLNQLREVKIFP